MSRVFVAGTPQHFNFPVITNLEKIPKAADVELIVDRDTVGLIEKVKPYLNSLNSIAVSYFSLREGNFQRMDEWFFERVATPLFDLMGYCKQNGLVFNDSSLNKYSLLGLFGNDTVVTTPPKRVFVELTRNCNSCCIMCLTRVNNPKYQVYNPKHNMKLQLFQQIADMLFASAEFVDLRGFGESTILKDFDKFLDYALRFNTRFGLVTNGTVQNDRLWKRLTSNNFLLDISIDGATKQTYEHIRKGLRWEHLMHNVKLLVATGLKDLSFLFTVQKDNIHEMPALIKLADTLGVKHVKFAAVTPEELYAQIYGKFSKEHVDNLFADTRSTDSVEVEWLSRFGGRIDLPYQVCIRPREYLFINYDGSLSPCNGFLTEQSFGQFQGDWREFYNTPPIRALRASLGTKFEFSRCSWCNANRRN